MGKIESLYEDYKDICQEFGEDVIRERFQNFCVAYEEFISNNRLNGKVQLNTRTLLHAILDYFTDISRLKSFHKIRRTNSFKVTAYEVSWLLRRKPLQILQDDIEELVYVNEKFVLSYIMNYFTQLIGYDFLSELKEKNERAVKGYINSLYYYLKYRNCNSQTLEFALLSVAAGIAATNCELSKEMQNSFSEYEESESRIVHSVNQSIG